MVVELRSLKKALRHARRTRLVQWWCDALVAQRLRRSA